MLGKVLSHCHKVIEHTLFLNRHADQTIINEDVGSHVKHVANVCVIDVESLFVAFLFNGLVWRDTNLRTDL